MTKKVFDRIMAGLEAAIAAARGDMSKVIIHTPEDIARRRRQRHRERAGLKIVKSDNGS